MCSHYLRRFPYRMTTSFLLLSSPLDPLQQPSFLLVTDTLMILGTARKDAAGLPHCSYHHYYQHVGGAFHRYREWLFLWTAQSRSKILWMRFSSLCLSNANFWALNRLPSCIWRMYRLTCKLSYFWHGGLRRSCRCLSRLPTWAHLW